MGTKSKWLKGKLTFYNGPAVEENVLTAGTTVAMTIRNYGLVVLNPAAAASYYINGGPAIGQKLDIVVHTSEIASIFACSTAGQTTITGAGPAATTTYNGAVSIPGAGRPCSIQLRGVSTSKWAITSCSTQKGGFSLTTAVA